MLLKNKQMNFLDQWQITVGEAPVVKRSLGETIEKAEKQTRKAEGITS